MSIDIFLIKNIIFICTFLIICLALFLIKNKSRQENLFLLFSSLITLLVTAILSVKLHHLVREEFKIPNTITYLAILLPVLIYFYKFKDVLLKSNIIVLLISVGCLGIALIIDLLTDAMIMNFNNSNYVEENLRIGGAIFWLLYYISFIFKLRKK